MPYIYLLESEGSGITYSQVKHALCNVPHV